MYQYIPVKCITRRIILLLLTLYNIRERDTISPHRIIIPTRNCYCFYIRIPCPRDKEVRRRGTVASTCRRRRTTETTSQSAWAMDHQPRRRRWKPVDVFDRVLTIFLFWVYCFLLVLRRPLAAQRRHGYGLYASSALAPRLYTLTRYNNMCLSTPYTILSLLRTI